MARIVLNCIGFVLLGLINVALSQTTAPPTLNVASVLHYPNLYEAEDGSYHGFILDLLELMGVNYKLSINTKYGHQYENGSWAGMMGELVDQEADIAGLLTVSNSRAQFVDFLYPIQSASPAIVLKKPKDDKPSVAERLSRLLEPLEFSVWLLSILSLLVTGTVLYIISYFNPYEWRRMYKDREATHREAESFTCLNSFWFVISTLMWQGYVRAPRSVGARILVTSWWAFVVIFLVSYTASLTNYLRFGREMSAVQGYSSITSFSDLANSELRVGILPDGSTEHSFRDSKNEVFKQLYDKILEGRNKTNLGSTDELVTYVRDQKFVDYAAILESNTAMFVTHQKPCDLYMVKDDFNLRAVSFAVQKGSPLRDELTKSIIRLHESGDIHYLENKWFKQQCSSNVLRADENQYIHLSNFYALDLGTFSAALLILIFGVVLGCVVTLIEVCLYKWTEMRVDDEDEPANQRSGSQGLLESDVKKGGSTNV
ncbi:hypothetical protein ACF0H5_002875 [Mactra antiquata]